MRHSNTARLARWQIRLLVWSGLALWLTGAGWLGLHYFGQVQGEFGPETNPLEPWMLKLHGAAMIAALLGLGGLFVAHIGKGWKHRGQRAAGLVLSALLIVLIATGWLLYYAGGDALQSWSGTIHWTLGLAAPAAFVWHYLNGKRLRRRRPARPGSRPAGLVSADATARTPETAR